MIDKQYLIDTLNKPIGLNILNNLIKEIESERDVELIYSLSKSENKKVEFHCAWLLEKLCTKDPWFSVHFLSDLLNDFNKISNHSALREFSKIIAMLLNNKAKLPKEISEIIDNSNKEKIIETCFNHIINKKTPISLNIWLVDILLYYSQEEDWIKEELNYFAQSLQIQSSPAKLQCIKRIKKGLTL